MNKIFYCILLILSVQNSYCQKNSVDNGVKRSDSVLVDLDIYSNFRDNNFQFGLKEKFFKVALYNEAVFKGLNAPLLKAVLFTYDSNDEVDSISDIQFYKNGELITIEEDSTKGGMLIRWKRIGFTNDFNFMTGQWIDGLRDGIFIDYYPLEKEYAIITTYKYGKKIKSEVLSR